MRFRLQEQHKPLRLYRIVSYISCGLLFVAFLLFLLVSISLPIIKGIYILALRSTVAPSRVLSLATQLRFGVWGFCASSTLDPATPFNAGLCSTPALGYTVPSYVSADLGISQDIINVVQKALIAVLVLHPIVGGLSLLTLISSLFLASHAFSIFTLFLAVVTALAATVTFIVDLALVLVARAELNNIANIHFAVDFGPAVWMILVATIFTWLAVITLSARACYCLGVRRHPRDVPRAKRTPQTEKNQGNSSSTVQTA
ncbi:hypothetical protein GALMADRAFT_248189 [Galerina marginata CBS 339.88]|uniref:Pali-domain-containing protein n=1 Tax=Galerina marginata (strain CBS 339.88) TaxID=685588 RepID=A0A067SZX6_GALM3|nr:hypothetical protein GALMADRAFT_248189 [Galerina marginata CBS 339.88]